MRIAAAILAVCLAPSAWVAWTVRDQMVGQGHDDGLYAIGGKALAEGRGYRVLSLPGEPYQTKYPPLMPALIAALIPLTPEFPRHVPAMIFAVWLFLPLLTGAFYLFLKRAGAPPAIAIAVPATVALSPLISYFSAVLFTDVACTALLVCSFLMMQRAADRKSGWGGGLLAGAAGSLSILMRTAAVPLLLSGPLWLLYRGRRRSAAACFISMALPVAWWVWWSRRHVPASSDPVTLYYLNYTGWYFADLRPGDLWLFVSQNTERFLTALSELLSATFPGPSINIILSAVLLAAAVSGAVRWARSAGASPYHFFAPGYLALVLVWHYRPDPRFVIPLFPFYVAGLAWEARYLLSSLRAAQGTGGGQRYSAVGLKVVALLLGLLIVRSMVLGIFFQIPAEAGVRNELRESLERSYDWIEKNTPPDAKFLSFYDPMIYLYTGRQGIQQPRSPKPFFRDDHSAQFAQFQEWPDFCRRYGLDYLALTTLDINSTMSEQDNVRFRREVLNGGSFQQVYSSPGIEIYRLAR